MQTLQTSGQRRSTGWVESYSSVTAVLVLVVVVASASLLTLWSSIQAIQRTLPAERLMRERDFAALHQDISRMRQSLELFSMSPNVQRLSDLRLTMDIVSIRAKDNLRSYGGTEAGIDAFHADLKQWIAEFDGHVSTVLAQDQAASLLGFSLYVKGREAVWLALGRRAQTLNDEAFQSSISSANSQIEQLERLRTYLFLFIGLTAAGALALSLSLLRQRSAYQKLQALDDEVRELAFLDPLTHLANRRLLIERLQHFLDSGARNGQLGALLYLDLDHFKMLNDTEGHDAGDELLQLIAQRLSPTVRSSDTVARFGGDEFVVLLEDLGTVVEDAAGSAEQVAEKIRAAFEQPFRLEKSAAGTWQRSVSIGMTVISAELNSVDNVLRQADIALYQAKESGRNTIRFFDSAMQAAVQKHAAMESAMRAGIAAHDFLVFYQPMVDVHGRFCGAEALVRWKSVDGTLIAPGQFIPLAEETGLIVPLGLWILKNACAQWVQWMELWGHSDLRLSVNVSAKQIHQSGFVDDVKCILEATGIAPHCLVVEVTESAILRNLEDTEKKLNALKAMGIGIALDDFGTGYSSLTYVQRLPFSELKIDQSFVANIGRDTGNEAICAATVALARGMGLRIVVEGVETPQQRDFFSAKHPIDYMQGYLFSKPLSAGEFAAFAQSAMGQIA